MSIKCIKHPDYPEKIISRIYSGTLDVDEILLSWKRIINEKMITSETCGILQFMGDAQINITMKDFEHVMTYINSNEEFKKIKIATVSYTPNSIVFPILGEKFYPNLNIKPFSTVEAATLWLID
jgi:hypothetical protein